MNPVTLNRVNIHSEYFYDNYNAANFIPPFSRYILDHDKTKVKLMYNVSQTAYLLRQAASDFWWTDNVNVIKEDDVVISYSSKPQMLFNQVVPLAPISNHEELIRRVKNLHPKLSRWVITDICGFRLPSALKLEGYSKQDEHGGYVVDVMDLQVSESTNTITKVVDLGTMREMYKARIEIFGGIFPSDKKQLELELEQCTNPQFRVERFLATQDGVVTGTGSITYFDELSFALIWAGGVREQFRGKGIYKDLLATRAEACKMRGIQYMGLFAKKDSSGPIVAAQGFTKVDTMTHYEKF